MTNEREKKGGVSFKGGIFICLDAKHLVLKIPLCHHSKHFNFDLKNFVQLSRGIRTVYKSAKIWFPKKMLIRNLLLEMSTITIMQI